MAKIGLTSDKLPQWRDLYLTFRRNFEWVVALITASNIFLWQDEVTEKFLAEIWDLRALYSAIFDWSSIQTAFIFGVYAFFLSRTENFLKAVASSPFFPELRRYVLHTLYLSMTLTILALPMLVAPVDIRTTFGYLCVGFLFTLTIFTFFRFFKIIRTFGKIDRRG